MAIGFYKVAKVFIKFCEIFHRLTFFVYIWVNDSRIRSILQRFKQVGASHPPIDLEFAVLAPAYTRCYKCIS
jgi:hypothetical protein